MNYRMICQLLDHYTDLYNNATSIEQRVIAREAMEHYQRQWEAFNN
jgi:hypothetical protein